MNKNRTIEIIETADGSKSLIFKELNETYHSINGALTESRHVFIKEGLEYKNVLNKETSILEIGFGTGLNAMLTLEKSIFEKYQINYTTLEPYPLSFEIIEKLKYFDFFDDSIKEKISLLHNCEWNKNKNITEIFYFIKLNKGIENLAVRNEFDLVYFDAFSPEKQVEMWEIKILQKTYDSLKKEGILVTYCAKGQFRRNLQSIGFNVERILGPPGKREMIRATK